MTRKPQQVSIDNPRMLGGMDILYNNIIPYDVPRYSDGNLWRYIAGRQPVVQDCITSMVMFIQSLPWDIRAKEPKDNKKRQDEIDNYKRIFNDAGGTKRLNHIDYLVQDYYTVPFGGASEAVRYSDGRLFKIINVDAATLYPTNNPALPVMQKVGIREPIFYEPDQIVRMYQTPRTEIQRHGWGMTPVEKVYLAVELISRGDKYYAQLLLDTPEAGLLDLGDMSRESAEKWLGSFKSLLSGIDAFKIPVLYEHNVPAKFIPFGRAPNDLLFDSVTFKYAELTCAAFGISIGDIGLKHPGGGSVLSAQMRDERHARATGYASLKAHMMEYYNSFMPEYLEFIFIDTDDEILVAKGRARSANAIGMRNFIEAGVMTPEQARDQMVADGLITIPIEDTPPNPSDFDIVKDISGLTDQIDIQQQQVDIQKDQLGLQQDQFEHAKANPAPIAPLAQNKIGGQGGTGLNKQRNARGGKVESVVGKAPVPASQGGMGEIKSMQQTELAAYIDQQIQWIKERRSTLRTRKLIKTGLKKGYATVKSASVIENYGEWKTEYLKMLFDQGENEKLKQYVADQIREFSNAVSDDKWWRIEFTDDATNIFTKYYSLGLELAANEVQAALYEDGKVSTPEIGKSFTIKNEVILTEIKEKSKEIETRINNALDYFLVRLSLGAIAEVTENNLELVQTKSLEEILANDDFINEAADVLDRGFDILTNQKIIPLADTAEDEVIGLGIQKQYSAVGVKDKLIPTQLDGITTNYFVGE